MITGQQIKGSILFWLLVGSIIVAALTGHFTEAGGLVATLVAGVVLYQVVGWTIKGVTGGHWNPFNVGRDRSADDEWHEDQLRAESELGKRKARAALDAVDPSIMNNAELDRAAAIARGDTQARAARPKAETRNNAEIARDEEVARVGFQAWAARPTVETRNTAEIARDAELARAAEAARVDIQAWAARPKTQTGNTTEVARDERTEGSLSSNEWHENQLRAEAEAKRIAEPPRRERRSWETAALMVIYALICLTVFLILLSGATK